MLENDIRTGIVFVFLVGSKGGEGLERSTLQFKLTDALDNVFCESTIGGDEGTLRVGEGDDGSSELDDFEGGELGDVSRAGDGDKSGGFVEAELGA